ncbi:type I restriction-modification system subunit M [Streptacidiphilus melanogenes]|uniref:type I restriction-modification system subunit M n=1 Tax=Streptacidiphilus melanogenes TaxID=411235 RepID=UPI0005AABCE8|nr:class I SAM-dependent DNA methyltransferase [Streptacidiphilus melanogenes]
MSTVAPSSTVAQTNSLVAKLWNYCNVLRDNGLSTIEYVEQLSYLLFLKMADELTADPFAREAASPIIPSDLGWQSLASKRGEELEAHYRQVLTKLGKHPNSTLGTVFAKAQNRITEPALLEKLVVELIGKTDWVLEGTDLKGDAYEGLLAKGAEDTKTGAGQYFTPRPLIDAMVKVMRPRPDDTITDPACGTAGFLIAAHSYLREHHLKALSREQRLALGQGSIWGNELVPGTARLAAMNMLLHGIGEPGGASLITTGDALAEPPSRRASLILANPPFGKKSAITVVGTDGKTDREDVTYDRSDFRATTTNKQLNFLQHIMSLLEMDGRAAVVVPDNVLYEGGPGEKIRRRLLQEFDLHTILRLPTGIFYAGGVKANVLFFDKKPPRADDIPNTSEVWVYDFRTGMHFTLKQHPLRLADLAKFIEAYQPDNRSARKETEDGRFKRFTYKELIDREKINLDISWLRDPALDDAESMLAPEIIAQEIVEDLQAALVEFEAITEALGGEVKPDVASEEVIAEA